MQYPSAIKLYRAWTKEATVGNTTIQVASNRALSSTGVIVLPAVVYIAPATRAATKSGPSTPRSSSLEAPYEQVANSAVPGRVQRPTAEGGRLGRRLAAVTGTPVKEKYIEIQKQIQPINRDTTERAVG